MLYCDRIDVSEGIDIGKTSALNYYHNYRYWYLLKKVFKFQPNVFNGCHDVLMSINLNDIAILNINGADYCVITTEISKGEALHLL